MNRDILLKILDLARWAPSGDNTQPWRFEIVSDTHIAVHGHDTREHVLYDFDGHASQMAHGALLETLRLAATRFACQAEWSVRPDQADNAPIYDVILKAGNIVEDPLVAFIESRTVQRRAMRMRPLSEEQRSQLTASIGSEFTLQFFETFSARLAVARLLWENAYIRLTCPEAFPVHQEIIEWGARFSDDRIPEEAVGVDSMTAKLMKWVMRDWQRVKFFNRFLFGTIAPRIQLDFIPAMACASHVLLKPKKHGTSRLIDRIAAGVALQRLWLTSSQLGLHLQPEMTPVIFRWYVQAARSFSTKAKINAGAVTLARQFERVSSAEPDTSFVFFCRVGYAKAPRSRSLRKELGALLRK